MQIRRRRAAELVLIDQKNFSSLKKLTTAAHRQQWKNINYSPAGDFVRLVVLECMSFNGHGDDLNDSMAGRRRKGKKQNASGVVAEDMNYVHGWQKRNRKTFD